MTVDLLRESFYALKRKAAPGVDVARARPTRGVGCAGLRDSAETGELHSGRRYKRLFGQSVKVLAGQVCRAWRRRPTHPAVDPEMAQRRGDGGRKMVKHGDRHSTGFGGHAPYTKGNFARFGLRSPHFAVELKESEYCDEW